jgi:hypothetical protein
MPLSFQRCYEPVFSEFDAGDRLAGIVPILSNAVFNEIHVFCDALFPFVVNANLQIVQKAKC